MSNPSFDKKTFKGIPTLREIEAMSYDGVVTKTFGMLCLALFAGGIGWVAASTNSEYSVYILLASIVLAFIVGFYTIVNKSHAHFTAPLYSILEGFSLGYISRLYEIAYEGIILSTIVITCSIFLCMLLIYKTQLIRVTENFRIGVAAATGGVALTYLIDLGLRLFGLGGIGLLDSNSFYGWLLTGVIIFIASLNLVTDFDFIEQGVNSKAPKHMEWYASFGLIVTIVWIYLEVLKALAKSRRR